MVCIVFLTFILSWYHCSKSNTFLDVKNLLKDASCSSAACIPLVGQFPADRNSEATETTSTQSSKAFGSLCIAFQHDIIPKETVAAAHSLSRSLAALHGQALRSHAETIISCLGASMHPSPEDDTSSSEGYSEERQESVPLENEEMIDDNDASCSRLTSTTPALTAAMQTTAAQTTKAPFQNFWMTFTHPTLEKSYLTWSARHMRPLDPAATLLACVFFCAIGFSPSISMAFTHPMPWATGWTALIPMLLCVLPATNHIYMAHRESFLIFFHISSLVWHILTANATKYLGTAMFLIYGNAKSSLVWQFSNLAMFQLNWKYSVYIALTIFFTNTLPLAPELCRLFPHGTDSGIDTGARCVRETLLYGAAQLLVVIVGLRFNECRMRKLFLNSLETKQQQQEEQQQPSSSTTTSGSPSLRLSTTKFMACFGLKEKVV
jgi:hypothetical protein